MVLYEDLQPPLSLHVGSAVHSLMSMQPPFLCAGFVGRVFVCGGGGGGEGVRGGVCACVRACVCVRARARACVSACVRLCVCACVRACVRAYFFNCCKDSSVPYKCTCYSDNILQYDYL